MKQIGPYEFTFVHALHFDSHKDFVIVVEEGDWAVVTWVIPVFAGRPATGKDCNVLHTASKFTVEQKDLLRSS